MPMFDFLRAWCECVARGCADQMAHHGFAQERTVWPEEWRGVWASSARVVRRRTVVFDEMTERWVRS
jgi:hypothetical protein